MEPRVICIVGAGMAGGRAAEALRERGYEGRLVLVGEEPEPPYERPPLSKAYLSGELARDRLLLRGADFYAGHGIERLAGTSGLWVEPSPGRLGLSDSEVIGFDRLLLATGSSPLRLELPGAELEGVRTYRTLADADRLREELGSSPRVLVVGGGFLGTELAAAARTAGCRVTLVEVGPALLAQLGEEVSRVVARLHLEQGVELRLGQTVARFRGGSRLESATLEGGELIDCDLALICVGARPNSELAGRAGLRVDPGVVVDSRCRAWGGALVAAGDVASWWSRRWGRRLRLEHYDNAHQQGLFAAGALLGDRAPFDPLPYFWTEQYQAMIQQVGIPDPGAETVVRGDPDSGHFSVFQLRRGRLRSCVAVNRFPDLAAARRLIMAGTAVTRELLGDPRLDLREWSRRATEAAAGG